jgi:NADH-quinone oxidoreductase subunit L
MFRLLFVVFFKSESAALKANHHVHESPKVMLYPMAVLAVLSVIGGFVEFPKLFSDNQIFSNYLNPVFEKAYALVPANEHALSHETEWLILVVPLLIIATLIFVTYKRFVNDKDLVEAKGINVIPANKFYFDEIYQICFVKPIGWLSDFFRETVDQTIINRLVNSVGQGTLFVGRKLRLLQTGNVGFYLFIMVFSVIAILFFNIIL